MGAVGNYEVVAQAFDLPASPGPNGQTINVPVPSGKVALGWGVENVQVSDPSGTPTGVWNRDLIVHGFPASDGSSVDFVFTEAQANGGTRAAGTLFVTCAEMGC